MHTRNVEYLAICLHLWLAISAVTTKDMGNVTTCEGETGSFSWNDDTQNLHKVKYFFKSNFIAETFSPNFSSVETLKYRLRVLEVDNSTFQIDNVTTEDSGEYKINLIYTYGKIKELNGRLDVKEYVLGNFNITCKRDTGVCTCGNNTGSDLYTWVFENPEGVITNITTTNECRLELGVFPQNGTVFCKRRSDCNMSSVFNFTSVSSPCPTMGPTGRKRRRIRSDEGDPNCSPNQEEGEEVPASDSATYIIIGIAFLVGIAVFVAVLIVKKRRSRAEQGSDRSEERTSPELCELVVLEDKNGSTRQGNM